MMSRYRTMERRIKIERRGSGGYGEVKWAESGLLLNPDVEEDLGDFGLKGFMEEFAQK